MSDFRFAARMLLRSPGFTLVAAGLLALGIGANAVIFSALDAVVLRRLPVRHPEELVRMVQKSPQLGTRSIFNFLYYDALRDRSTTLSAVFGEAVWYDVAMTEPAPAEKVQVYMVTPNFFDQLGVRALYGRVLTADDGNESLALPPAVLSYEFFERRFNGDPGTVGKTIVMHRQRFVIVGVTPRGFNGISADTSPDIRVPLRTLPLLIEHSGAWDWRKWGALDLSGRLKPGVTRQQAYQECLLLWRRSEEAYEKQFPDFSAKRLESELARSMEIDPLERGVSILRDRFGGALKLMIALVGLLLLMVCANVAGLLLARSALRREEIAVRLAIGATRARLVRQMLTESALLTALGAAGGVALAYILAPLLVRALPPIRDVATNQLTLALDLRPDGRVLLFSLAISAITAVLFGVAPAVSAARSSLDSVLRGARSSGGWRGRQALIVFQVALCTLLLAGAALLVRTFEHLRDLDPGFDRDHIVTFSADPSLASYTPDRAKALRDALEERVRQLPGVVSVADASRALMRGSGLKMTVAPMGQSPTRADFLNSSMNGASPGYFETMGMHILEGRGLNAEDASRKPKPTVVNQAFVRRFYPTEDPIGKRFGGGSMGEPAPGDNEIVGVVTDAKYRSLREPMTPTIYNLRSDSDPLQLIVRTRMRPESIIQPVRQALAALDPALPFTEIHTLAEEVDASTAGEQLTAALASIFGVLAAALAAVGIYGLLAYIVASRRREIGIRMALGARASDIGEMIAWQALPMIAAGVIAGIGAAWASAPWIRSLLYGIAPTDPESFTLAAGFVVAVAIVAILLPALRATRTQPAMALRSEK